jgi:DNA invertase Pin-like site-specific DNA recombinase
VKQGTVSSSDACFAVKKSKLSRVSPLFSYKVDRLSRSLLDFAQMMEVFERHGVSFVSVTQ